MKVKKRDEDILRTKFVCLSCSYCSNPFNGKMPVPQWAATRVVVVKFCTLSYIRLRQSLKAVEFGANRRLTDNDSLEARVSVLFGIRRGILKSRNLQITSLFVTNKSGSFSAAAFYSRRFLNFYSSTFEFRRLTFDFLRWTTSCWALGTRRRRSVTSSSAGVTPCRTFRISSRKKSSPQTTFPHGKNRFEWCWDQWDVG